jgi:flagellar basal-body rod protein FlgB
LEAGSVFDDVTSVALHAALRGLTARQRAVADNVSNIQTPGFLAGRVQFEDALREAVSSGDSTEVAATGPSIARSLEPTRTDGNNVNLDTETLSGMDTNMRYELAIRALDGKYTSLSKAAASF